MILIGTIRLMTATVYKIGIADYSRQRLVNVRRIKQNSVSEWAQSYWAYVEKELVKKYG